MKTWQLQTAKNQFSELVQKALDEGPQMITRYGKPAAVVISFETYRKAIAEKMAKEPLASFFANSPLHGEKVSFTRTKDLGREEIGFGLTA